MSLTKVLNSKSNIKQTSTADIPTSVRQPVINRMAAESTLNQTVINLGFSIDTLNNPDVFMLTVDGKLMTPGTANDYVFTSVDSFGMSSQVTMNVALASGLNIQGIKLGLKKETEFAQDARFSDVYEAGTEGFQGFVKTSDVMSATSIAGTPVAGSFYSTVVNRSPMMDLTKDLKARMGIDRLSVTGLIDIQNEFGPNGEKVFAAYGDTLNQFRFVGAWGVNPGQGFQVQASTSLLDFMEITFYGTGLNLLGYVNGTAFDIRASVDGGSEGSNILPNASTVINNRNYASNTIVPVFSGLTAGVHTVKLRNNNASNGFNFHGVEILNETTTIRVPSGTSYVGSKKLSLVSSQAISYNSGFESGVLGTKGGRVIVYQKADGTVGKALTPTASSQLNYTSTDHSQEEISRVYHWREFGCGRSDDFSLTNAPGGVGALGFTLDDGTTSLVAATALTNISGNALGLATTSGSFVTLTFVGTGLDIVRRDNAVGATTNWAITVDGISTGTISDTGSTSVKTQKIVSGLPYGTHNVRIAWSSGTGYNLGILQFVTYQPKKPTIPSGSVELSDYNIMANFSIPSNTAGAQGGFISSGVLRKVIIFREATYTGTWGIGGMTPSAYDPSTSVNSSTNGGTISYTFFGTGFDFRAITANGYGTFAVSLNGTALNASYPGAASINVATYGLWTFGGKTANTNYALNTVSTNVLSNSTTTAYGNGFAVSGLSLGTYTVTFTKADSLGCEIWGLDIITPIHSIKSNVSFQNQGIATVGSQGISDTRKLSAVKDSISKVKNVSRAVGIASAPTTSSTSMIPVPDLSVMHFNTTGKINLSFTGTTYGTGGLSAGFRFYIDGVAVGSNNYATNAANGYASIVTINDKFLVSPGFHKVDVYWSVSGGTQALADVARSLIVEEEL